MIGGATKMANEIGQIAQSVQRLLDQSAQSIAEAAREVRLRDPDLICTIARGSSDHAATYLKYAIELTAKIPVGIYRTFGFVDLWCITQTGKFCGGGHFTIRQKPRYCPRHNGCRKKRCLYPGADKRHQLASGSSQPPFDRYSRRTGKKRCRYQDLRYLNRRRAFVAGTVAERRCPCSSARTVPRSVPKGHQLRLVASVPPVERGAVAINSRARALNGDRRGSGAEIQRDLPDLRPSPTVRRKFSMGRFR